jgi:hypothetical protein
MPVSLPELQQTFQNCHVPKSMKNSTEDQFTHPNNLLPIFVNFRKQTPTFILPNLLFPITSIPKTSPCSKPNQTKPNQTHNHSQDLYLYIRTFNHSNTQHAAT